MKQMTSISIILMIPTVMLVLRMNVLTLQNNPMGLIIISISILFSVFGVFLFKGKMVLMFICGIKLFFKIISFLFEIKINK
jgi:hypothetical protein